MTNQEALTKVVLHARQQDSRAVGTDGYCTYWAADGKRCFLGCLLTEEAAGAAVEAGTDITDVAESLGLERDFGADLVWVHDREPPDCWEDKLRSMATQWKLVMPGQGMARAPNAGVD